MVRFTTPARAAPEWANMGAPRSKAKMCTTFTMAPRRASAIGSMKRRMTFQVPLRLRSTTDRQPLSEIPVGSAGNCPPALLTRQSTRPKFGVRGLAQVVHLVGLADVGRHGQAAPAQRRHLLRHRLEARRRSAGHHDVGTEPGERQGDLAPEAGAPAGDHRHPVGEGAGGEDGERVLGGVGHGGTAYRPVGRPGGVRRAAGAVPPG